MGVKISRTNPLRFRPRDTKYIDYNFYYPRFDLMQFREDYQRGIYANPNYRSNYALNDTVIVQVNESLALGTSRVINLVTGETFNMTQSDVTPVDWATPSIYNLSIGTNTIGEGIFRIDFGSASERANFISDDFIVTDSSLLKDLVQIQYYDSKNSFDGVFWNGTDWIWQPIRYFTGQIITGEGSSEYSIYNNQSGVPIKQRAEVTDSMVINLTDISQYEKPIVDRIFGCDNILANGVLVQNEEKPEYEVKEKSDLCDISINATITEEDNNSYNFS